MREVHRDAALNSALLLHLTLSSYLLNGVSDTFLDVGLLLECEGFHLGQVFMAGCMTQGNVSESQPAGGVVGIVPSDPMRTFIWRQGWAWRQFGLGWGILRHAPKECHNRGAEFDTEQCVYVLSSLWKSLWKVCTRYNPPKLGKKWDP